MEDKQKLLRIIEKKPGIERRELLRFSHMKVNVFDPLVSTLLQEGSAHKERGRYYAASHSSPSVTTAGVTQNDPDFVGSSL